MNTSKPGTKLSSRILEEASAWFVEFSEGDVGARGREEFNTWLRRSPEHIQAYLQIAALWEDTPLLEEGRTLGADELVARALAEGHVIQLNPPAQEAPKPDEALQQGPRDRSHEGGVTTTDDRVSQRRMRLVSTAAMFLIAIVGTAIWYGLYRAPTYATDIGEQRSVRLSDGSTVEINSRSKLRVRFSEHERLVELLEGQAMFWVAKDHKRPFVVDSNGTRVRAVGTRFDVYRRSNGTVVTVLEGRVAVGSPLIEDRQPVDAGPGDAEPASLGQGLAQEERQGAPSAPQNLSSRENAGGAVARARGERTDGHELPVQLTLSSNEVLLAAGQRLTVTPIAWTAPEPADIEAATAWTRREIVFQGSPLSDVIEEFNRYNPRKMVISDPSLRDTRISGVFSSTDPNSLLRFLGDLPSFNVQETEDEVRISSK